MVGANLRLARGQRGFVERERLGNSPLRRVAGGKIVDAR